MKTIFILMVLMVMSVFAVTAEEVVTDIVSDETVIVGASSAIAAAPIVGYYIPYRFSRFWRWPFGFGYTTFGPGVIATVTSTYTPPIAVVGDVYSPASLANPLDSRLAQRADMIQNIRALPSAQNQTNQTQN